MLDSYCSRATYFVSCKVVFSSTLGHIVNGTHAQKLKLIATSALANVCK